jgi:hypothetical protein
MAKVAAQGRAEKKRHQRLIVTAHPDKKVVESVQPTETMGRDPQRVGNELQRHLLMAAAREKSKVASRINNR